MSPLKISRIESPYKIELLDWEHPTLEKDEVKVRVVSCGICTSDQGIYVGGRGNRFPFFPGHEVVGFVEELGEFAQSNLKIGDKVVVSRMHKCGQCEYCRRGEDNRCKNSKALYRPGKPAGQGGMAEYLYIPSYQVFKLRDDADMLSYSLIEPVACCVGSVLKGNVNFGDTVLVVGAGIMGLLHAELLRLMGARVVISELDPARREFAKDYADIVLDPTEDITQTLLELTDGYGVRSVFLAAGPTSLIPESFDYLAGGGHVVLYTSYYQKNGPLEAIDMNKLHYKEFYLIGTVSPSNSDWRKAIDLVQNKKIDLSKYVTQTYPLSEVHDAFERSLKSDVYRVVVRMDKNT